MSLRDGTSFEIEHGAVVIAAITSCTNTSNPDVMVGAALLAKKAVERGLKTKPWVKTTLAPGSKVVIDYFERAGLTPYLNELGFDLVGFGCTTCIGNSGPLIDEVSRAVADADLAVAAVLSGNRNFEGRIHPETKLNYLASPPLVVAYALAGSMNVDLTRDPLGLDATGEPVYLRDIWPNGQEVQEIVSTSLRAEMFSRGYADVYAGGELWRDLPTSEGELFIWDAGSTYVRRPPYFEGMSRTPEPLEDIEDARVLALLGDSVTTDHISPAGAIKTESPAGRYLSAHGLKREEFNSYGSRRGNHQVMIRGTFANIRLRNLLAPGTEGDSPAISPTGSRPPSSTRRCATPPKAYRCSSSRARTTARAPHATGRPRAPHCSASGPSWPNRSSASTAPTWSGWVSCRCSSLPARTRGPSASPGRRRSPSTGWRALKIRPTMSRSPRTAAATASSSRRRCASTHPPRPATTAMAESCRTSSVPCCRREWFPVRLGRRSSWTPGCRALPRAGWACHRVSRPTRYGHRCTTGSVSGALG